MKHMCMTALCFFGIVVCGKSQMTNIPSDTIKVILENEKLIVTEYSSTPGKDICGKGNHSHNAHLSILLTDAKATLITPEGNVGREMRV